MVTPLELCDTNPARNGINHRSSILRTQRKGPMTLAQLEYVVAVDTFRHFGNAAEHCHVTQPTLSMQIQKLERHLGVDLFDRHRQPVEPTDIGRKLIEQSRVILRESGRIQEIIKEATGDIAGELRIGIIPTLAPYLLPRFVSHLVESYPKLTLVIEELRTEQILDRIQTDRLDAGLLATGVNRSDLEETALFDEPFVGYVSEREPYYRADEVGADDLRLDELWLLNEGHCFRDQVIEICEEAQRAPRGTRSVHFESGNLETLKRLVETSGGMTLLPVLATEGMTDQEMQRVRPFKDPPPCRVVRLVRGRGFLKRKPIEALREEIRRSLRSKPAGVRLIE